MTSGKPRVRGGVLVLLSSLLLGSAVLRLGVEAAPAIGREMSPNTGPESGTGQSQPPQYKGPAELQLLLDALQDREARLVARENLLEDQLIALKIAEEAIDKKLIELTQAEEKLRQTLQVADGAAEGDLEQLTNLYEKMKPKEAAALFEEMAPTFAAGFLSRMTPDAAASIMAGLSPKTAYSISVVFAGRNANVPTE